MQIWQIYGLVLCIIHYVLHVARQYILRCRTSLFKCKANRLRFYLIWIICFPKHNADWWWQSQAIFSFMLQGVRTTCAFKYYLLKFLILGEIRNILGGMSIMFLIYRAKFTLGIVQSVSCLCFSFTCIVNAGMLVSLTYTIYLGVNLNLLVDWIIWIWLPS